MAIYIKDILPVICKSCDDQNYGSSSTKDIEALQALSKRIHFGKYKKEKNIYITNNPNSFLIPR